VHQIAHTARWQRSVRRALVTVGGFGGGLADGVAGIWRGRR
jgi:hypothetical protein